MSFKPSIYQQAVFNFIANCNGNAVIQAVAGSGKTPTIIQSLNLIPTNKRILMLAFNKSIANELKEKVPFHFELVSFDPSGFASLRNSIRGRIQVKSNKVFNVINIGKLNQPEALWKVAGEEILQKSGSSFIKKRWI